jgi:hypothetical protein
MIAVVILIVSVVAFAQFWVYYWRATMSGVAAQAISDRIRVAAGIRHELISAQDFRSLLILKDLSPTLSGPSGSLLAIRTYYKVIEKIGRMVPAMASWANTEMATCSRYLAVRMDQHLQRNILCADQVRGM